jgi:hypothetical protein
MDKGIFSFSWWSSSAQTFTATHIVFSGDYQENATDSQPLGPVSPIEVEAIAATLKAHKHLFEAKAPEDRHQFLVPLLPGRRDFCSLY